MPFRPDSGGFTPEDDVTDFIDRRCEISCDLPDVAIRVPNVASKTTLGRGIGLPENCRACYQAAFPEKQD